MKAFAYVLACSAMLIAAHEGHCAAAPARALSQALAGSMEQIGAAAKAKDAARLFEVPAPSTRSARAVT